MNVKTPETGGKRPFRIATYNVEWFNDLFDKNDKLIENATWSARYNVTKIEQIDALAHVFQTIDADADEARIETVFAQHQDIIAAIRNADPSAAGLAAEAHLQTSLRHRLKVMQQ